MDKPAVFGAVFMVFAMSSLTLSIVSLSTDQWYVDSRSNNSTVGLWKICHTQEDLTKTCTTFNVKRVGEWYDAVRALVCLGVIGLAVAVICLLLMGCFESGSEALYMIGASACMCAGYVIVLGVIVYAANMRGHLFASGALGYSFYMMFFSVFTSFAAGGVGFAAIKKNYE